MAVSHIALEEMAKEWKSHSRQAFVRVSQILRPIASGAAGEIPRGESVRTSDRSRERRREFFQPRG